MSYNQIRTGYLVTPNTPSDARFLGGDSISGGSTGFTEAASFGTGTVTFNGVQYSGEYVSDQAGNVYFVPTGTNAGSYAGGGSVTTPTTSASLTSFYATATSPDAITGDGNNNALWGGTNRSMTGTGNDTMSGAAGNDALFGGDGNDSLSGGTGNDTILGGTGNDTVNGGTGSDALYGGDGTDTVAFDGAARINLGLGRSTSTTEGNDTVLGFEAVQGSAGNDSIWGTRTDDQLTGNGGADFLSGRAGNDTVLGGADNDTLYGGFGNDSVLGEADNDVLFGRAGADTVVGGLGTDTVNGGDGNDAVYGDGQNTGSSTLDGADSLLGGMGADTVYGGGGNDTISGGGGADTVFGGDGNDSIVGDGFTGTAASTTGTVNWGNFTTSASGGTAIGANGSLAEGGSQSSATHEVVLEYNNTSHGGGNSASYTSGQSESGVYYNNTTQLADGSTGSAFLYQTGSGETDWFAVNFASRTDAYQSAVRDVSFNVNDLDSGTGYTDRVIIRAYDTNGNLVPFTYTYGGTTTTNATSATITGAASSVDTNNPLGQAQITIAGPVARIEIGYDNAAAGGTAPHAVWISNINYSTVAATAGDDSLDGAAGDDTILGQDGNDTINGGAGNDSLLGGAGNDVLSGGIGADYVDGGTGNDNFVLETSPGADTIIGGEDAGNTDIDVLDATGIVPDGTTGVNVNYTGGEAGTLSVRGSGVSANFSQIERVVTGAGADSITAATSTGGINIATNAGADTIIGSGFADTIAAGGGNDRIEGGAGADNLDGGTGSDTFVMGNAFGNDTIAGGEDANGLDVDFLDGSSGTTATTVNFTSGENGTFSQGAGNAASFVDIERVATGSGNDTVTAGSSTGAINIATNGGNDSVTGSGFNDTISGGAGADVLDGGAGADSLDGGDGNDTLIGGAGADTMTGGAGINRFQIDGQSADVITDFKVADSNDGDTTNNDYLDLGSYYNEANLATWNATPGNPRYGTPLQWMRADLDDNGALDYVGGLTLTGVNATDLNQENTGAVCFAAGTMILTARGEVPVETLQPGDLVVTKDRGVRPVVWSGGRVLEAHDLQLLPKLRPIRIRAGALGRNLPASDLVVSPQHRMLVRSIIAERIFGETEVLVAANKLLMIDGIDVAEDLARIEYHHFMFDRHEVVFANGAESESLYAGSEALKSVGPASRAEILTLFPELQDQDHVPEPARRLAYGKMARKMASRHAQNGKALVKT